MREVHVEGRVRKGHIVTVNQFVTVAFCTFDTECAYVLMYNNFPSNALRSIYSGKKDYVFQI